MDADTTARRGSHHEILDRFRDGDVQVLVGTQMVAKGHDFPDVHLAAVVGVDHLLMLPDIRSAEGVHALVLVRVEGADRDAAHGAARDLAGRLRRWLRQVAGHLEKATGKGVRLTVDVDPRSLL